MSVDKVKLKALTEIMIRDIEGDLSDSEARNFHQHVSDYEAMTQPAAVLALLAEIDRLQLDAKNDAIAYKAAIEHQDEIRAERDQLKAENERISKDLESHKRMLLNAAISMGAIGEAMGAEMDDDASELEGLATELRKDAERYRWLRDPDHCDDDYLDGPSDNIVVGSCGGEDILWSDALDVAIDAAMTEKPLNKKTGD